MPTLTLPPCITDVEQGEIDQIVDAVNESIRWADKGKIALSSVYTPFPLPYFTPRVQEAVKTIFLKECWKTAEWFPDGSFRLTR